MTYPELQEPMSDKMLGHIRIHLNMGEEDYWTPVHKTTYRYLSALWNEYWRIRDEQAQQATQTNDGKGEDDA